jgi:hypothetical protein
MLVLVIPTPPSCVKFFRLFHSHVIRPNIILVMHVVLANTYGFPLASLPLFLLFRFSFYIVTSGHPRLPATRVTSII